MALSHALEATGRWALVVTLAKAALLLIGARLALSLYEGYQVRMRFRKLKSQGIPIAEHSLLWGHLKVLGRIGSLYPKDAHRHYIQIHMVQHWRDYFPTAKACPPVVYLDTWPVAEPMAVLVDPTMCQELVQERGAPKHAMIKHLVKYMCRGRSLTDFGGSLHRLWRSRLNPGFSAKNLQSHMATFVEEVSIYANKLKAAAGPNGDWGRVLPLMPLSTAMTWDIIGRVVLDIRLDEQTKGPTELQSTMQTMLLRHVMFKDLKTLPRRLNPLWRYEGWKCQQSFKRLLMPQILKQVGAEQATTQKTVVQLATKELNKSGNLKGVASFKEYTSDVLSLTVQFMFAGHDTTATSITWAFYYLSKAPEVLAKLRAEHDSVFGPDPRAAPQALLASPQLLNALPYTNAVVKEVLRLVPIAATAREGSPDMRLVAKDGSQYPTDGFVMITGTAMMHHHPDLWPRADEFLPERWLVSDTDPLYPVPYAWRPFEYGPMNCIGQELALMELRMTLLFTAREIDVECAWEEWDALRGTANETPSTLNGDRAYRSTMGLSYPKDNLPVHIRLRSPKA